MKLQTSILLLFFSCFSFAQIKGKVTDLKGNALPYASVTIEKTYIGTSTNENGEYELNIKKIVHIDAILQQYMYIHRAINKEYISINIEGKESVDVTTPGLRRYYTVIKKELLK